MQNICRHRRVDLTLHSIGNPRSCTDPSGLVISFLCLLLLFAGTTLQLQADQLQRFSASEIQKLLSGKTAIGQWDGKNYRQYFREDGITIYAQEGSRSSRGKWRVNSTENTYQSLWEVGGWTSYPVAHDGETLYWVSSSLPPQSFKLVEGEQLVAPDSN